MLRNYLRLTKPGVMIGNLITTVAGFLFASQGSIDWGLFLATNLGTSLVISSACVINNVLDQDIDSKMERTKNRPLIAGEADPTIATIFGIAIGALGLLLLAIFTNWLVVGVGVFGFISYVWLYGALTKRRSIHGTLVGALSGAAPILAGYVAVVPTIEMAGILLFLVLFFWQLPEFYSIAIYRRNEYKQAGVPVITVKKSLRFTAHSIFVYTLLFALSTIGLFSFGYTGYTYLVVMGFINVRWVVLAAQGLQNNNLEAWSKHMFRFSLIALLAFCALISVDHLLP